MDGLIYPDGSFRSQDEIRADLATRDTNLEFTTPIHHPPESFDWYQQEAVRRQEARREAVGRPEHAEVQLWSNAPIIMGLIGDVHSGGEDCEYDMFARDIAFIRDHPQAYVLLFGDLADCYFFTPAVHEHLLNLKEQYMYMQAALDELNGKIIGAWAGNHCLDEKTELFTDGGWKTHDKITLSDRILSVNLTTGFVQWGGIERLIRYPYSGKLNRIATVSVDILVTDEHRIFYKERRTGRYDYVAASHYMDRNDVTDIGIVRAGNSGSGELGMPDAWIRLAAWILTDGHIRKNGTAAGITQRPEKARLVRDVLEESGVTYTEKHRTRFCREIVGKAVNKFCDSVEFRIKRKKDVTFITDLVEGTKKKFPSWVWELSDRQFDVFLSSLVDGDGSRHKKGTAVMFYQKNRQIIDELQALCAMHGMKSSIYEYGNKQHKLNISRGNTTRLYKPRKEKEDYDGIVWDLTVPQGNFLARRNGKAYFTGNSLWSSRMGETFYRGWTERYNAHYFEGVAYVTTKVNDKAYRIVGSHKHRGYSVYNDSHASRRQVLDDAENADISITAHNHVKANARQMTKIHGGNARPIDYVALGSYSKSTGYSRVQGWHDKAPEEMGATFLVLFHDKKRVEVFNHREEVAERVAPYLK